ncbi:MAG: hypothetical protein L0228_17130 [Planctomycetes bacterium]|nr:hypothetical protein [Planctomycetota bacterium]
MPEQPFKAIPYDKLLCNGRYLCYEPRRPGYVVGMWTDRWIMLNQEMVIDAKVQKAARDCLVPCLHQTQRHSGSQAPTRAAAPRWLPRPRRRNITMTVPDGGDYSNMTLDIDGTPVHVEYITVEE